MGWKIPKVTDNEKRNAFAAALRRYRGEKRVSLRDVVLATRVSGVGFDAMRKFVGKLDAAALEEFGIEFERKGARGPVTVVFKGSTQQSAAERESVAA